MDFGVGVGVSVFPFGVKGVDMVKRQVEIRAGCATPYCHRMILVGEFLKLFIEVGVEMRVRDENADGRG